jgi:hypothetical protein
MFETETLTNRTVTIRRVDTTDADRAQLVKLAELDTRVVPDGPVLGAEVDGRLVAAIAVDNGEILADPFRPTSELQAMLKLRASQVQARPTRRRRGSRLIGRRTRPAVGGSPAGQIITLPRAS